MKPMKVMIKPMLAVSLITGQLPLSVFAQTSAYEQYNQLAVGNYTIENLALKIDSDEESMAGKFMDKTSALQVFEDHINVTVTFTSASMMSNLKVFVNGNEVKHEEVKDNNKLSLSFDLDSLSDEIKIQLTIMGAMQQEMRLVLNQDTLTYEDGVLITPPAIEEVVPPTEEERVPPIEDHIPPVVEEEEEVPPVIEEVSRPEMGEYYILTQAVKPGTTTESAASSFMNANSLLEVTEDEMYLTLRFTGKSAMSKQKIIINGEEVAYTTPYETDDEIHFKFKVSSLQDEISMSMTIMGAMAVSFEVLVDDTSLVPVGSTEITPPVVNPETPVTPEQKPTAPSEPTKPTQTPSTTPTKNELDYGVYTIRHQVLRDDSNEESMAAQYVNPVAQVDSTTSGMYLTLKFTGKSYMENHQVKVNQQTAPFEVVYDSGDELHIKFKITSLTDDISISTRVLGMRDVTFRVVLTKSSLVKISSDAPVDTFKPIQTTTSTSTSSTNTTTLSTTTTTSSMSQSTAGQLVSVNDLVVGETYTIKNQILTDSAIGYDTARQALNSTSYLTPTSTGYEVTFGFGMMDLMSNLRVSVNNRNVSYNVLRSSSTTKDIKFNVGSLSDKITITGYVEAISRDISFDVKLLTNSIYSMGANQANQALGVASAMPLSLSDEVEAEEEQLAEELEASDYMKSYRILNEVLSDSEMGREMARKYLEEESLLEEVDGVLYLSLTFTGSDLMNNVHFTVNGEAVEHEVTLSDDENHLKTYRFIIADELDEIEASMHIIPVSRDISFGVRLLPDTKTLMSEEVVEDTVETMLLMTDSDLVREVDETEEASSTQTTTILMTVVITTVVNALLATGVYFGYKKFKK